MKSLQQAGYHFIAHVLTGFLGGCLAVVLFFMSVPHRLSPPASMATVDMTGLIHHFVKVESAVSASPAQHQAQVRAFSQQLDQALQTVAHEQHVILLPKEAVIAGAVRDVTPDVAQRLQEFQPADSLSATESER